MKITHALLGEHAVLYTLFDHLESTLNEVRGLDRVRRQAELLAAALGSHARIENELLFEPAVEALGDAAGPVAQMVQEHAEIETRLGEAVAAPDAASVGDRLLDVVARARDHFEREESVAFEHAEAALGGERVVELGSEWAARRKVRLAPAGSGDVTRREEKRCR